MHPLISFIVDLLSGSFTDSDQDDEKQKAIQDAQRFVAVQMDRIKERIRIRHHRTLLLQIENGPSQDQELLARVKSEIELKERLINSSIVGVERNQYNWNLLEDWDIAEKEWEEYFLIKDRIQELEKAGSYSAEQISELRQKISEKEEWVSRHVL